MDFYQSLMAQASALAPQSILNQLIEQLRTERDHAGLFQALLLQARARLGLPLVLPTGDTSKHIPAAQQEPYEEAIRQAARTVGQLFLEDGDVAQAWPYFRLIGETAPVQAYLESIQEPSEEEWPTLLALAWQEGVHPLLGFKWILEQRGLCNAITTLTQSHLSPEQRQACVVRLLEALHRELVERLQYDLAQKGLVLAEPSMPLPDLLAAHPQLGQAEEYHIDLSHLSSVLEMALELPPGPALSLALELSQYGAVLNPRFQPNNEPPFEQGYRAFVHFFQILVGTKVEEGLAYFRDRAEQAKADQASTSPGEVLVHLLFHLGRYEEALSAYQTYLSQAEPRQLRCPSLAEISLRLGNFQSWQDWSRAHHEPVPFVTALLLSKQKNV